MDKQAVAAELAERVVLRHLEDRALDTTLDDIRFAVIDEIGRNEPDPETQKLMVDAAMALLAKPPSSPRDR